MSTKTTAKSARIMKLALTTALASTALTGCTGLFSPKGSYSAAQASAVAAEAQDTEAMRTKVAASEKTVMAAPRDLSARAQLAASYLEAGRFNSAAATFAEVIELGDSSPRTVVSYALAQLASGQSSAALATLDKYEATIDPADFGLAVALAGRPQQGIHVLGNALRSGQNTAKIRQNLAYAFALKGDWRSARLMAAQDLSGDKTNERLGQWAQTIAPSQGQARIAGLLNVPVVRDAGQPAALALNKFPEGAAFASAAPAKTGELAAIGTPAKPAAVPMVRSQAESAVPSSFAAAFTEASELPAVAAKPARSAPARPTVAQSARAAIEAAAPAKKPAAPVRVAAAKPAAVPTPVAAVAATPSAAPKTAAPKTATAKPATPRTPVQHTASRAQVASATPAASAPEKPAQTRVRRVTRNGVTYTEREVVQQVASHTPATSPARAATKPSSRPARSAPRSQTRTASRDGGYRVQLGSYFSMSDAQAAWRLFVQRHPELGEAQKVITKAKVKGKIYYRIAAGGYDRNEARSLCGRVKRGGGGCIAYAANNPLPGTIDNNVRVASR